MKKWLNSIVLIGVIRLAVWLAAYKKYNLTGAGRLARSTKKYNLTGAGRLARSTQKI